jgi:hypothetical protein
MSNVRRIYVASSWKNPFYDPLVATLQLAPDQWHKELMYSFADRVCVHQGELLACLAGRSLSGACW